MKFSWSRRAAALVGVTSASLLLALCAQVTASADSTVAGSAAAKVTARSAAGSAPVLQIASIAPSAHATVGVAMPISIVFAQPIKPSARAKVERAMTVITSVPVRGAWHWFSSQRVDFRPTTFWKAHTVVRVLARLAGVWSGYGRQGTRTYGRLFTIGADVESHVYAARHFMTVSRNHKIIRTMPIDAGSPQFPSWDGTMAVIDKAPEVRMTSCSVGISCEPSSPNYYDLVLPWDVRLTYSGTYIHYSTGDPYPGHSYGSHGCVHLSYANAQWFYNLSKMGDPVTITGTPRGKPAGDNGYADYSLSWRNWLAGSATGPLDTKVNRRLRAS